MFFATIFLLIFKVGCGFSTGRFFTPGSVGARRTSITSRLPTISKGAGFLLILDGGDASRVLLYTVFRTSVSAISCGTYALTPGARARSNGLTRVCGSSNTTKIMGSIGGLVNVSVSCCVSRDCRSCGGVFSSVNDIACAILGSIGCGSASGCNCGVGVGTNSRGVSNSGTRGLLECCIARRGGFSTTGSLLLTTTSRRVGSAGFRGHRDLFDGVVRLSGAGVAIGSFASGLGGLGILSDDAAKMDICDTTTRCSNSRLASSSVNSVLNCFTGWGTQGNVFVSGGGVRGTICSVLRTINRSPGHPNLLRAPHHITGVCRRVFDNLARSPRRRLGFFSRGSGSRVIVIHSVPFTSVYRRRLLPFINGTRVTCVPNRGGVVKLSGLTHVISGFTGGPRIRRELARSVTSFLCARVDTGNITIVVRTRRVYVSVHNTGTSNDGARASTLHKVVGSSTHAHRRTLTLLSGWWGVLPR